MLSAVALELVMSRTPFSFFVSGSTKTVNVTRSFASETRWGPTTDPSDAGVTLAASCVGQIAVQEIVTTTDCWTNTDRESSMPVRSARRTMSSFMGDDGTAPCWPPGTSVGSPHAARRAGRSKRDRRMGVGEGICSQSTSFVARTKSAAPSGAALRSHS